MNRAMMLRGYQHHRDDLQMLLDIDSSLTTEQKNKLKDALNEVDREIAKLRHEMDSGASYVN